MLLLLLELLLLELLLLMGWNPDNFFHQKDKMEAEQDVARVESQKEPNTLIRRHVAHTKRANHTARDVKVDCIIEYLKREF